MSALFKGGSHRPTRHGDPDEAVARYLEQLHQADVAGGAPPPAALNGLGDAYLDKEDPGSAADYWRQAAEAYAREGMHSSAVACLKKIRRHAPDEGNVGLLLGRAYAAKGLTADALGELDRYVDRSGRTGERRDRIEAFREIVRLAPERAERREELAGLLLEDGQREPGITELRAARALYEERRDRESARRVGTRLTELEGGGPPPPAEESAAPVEPRRAEGEEAAEPWAAVAGPGSEVVDPGSESGEPESESGEPESESGEPESEEEPVGGAIGFEIEPTSYTDTELREEPPEEVTVEQESVPPPHLPRDPGIRSDDLSEAESLEDAAAGLEDAAAGLEAAAAEPPAVEPPPTEPVGPPPEDLADLVDLARRQANDGDRDRAARNLLLAAEGLRAQERWTDAVRAYRALADLGSAKDEDLDDWAECARQAGRASEVLEALAVAARTRLARDDRLGARRAAEEMLLVDPHNAVAAEILERVGALPRGE